MFMGTKMIDPVEEAIHLVQKGFYVEPLDEPLDLNRMPLDGSEFIHQMRARELPLLSMYESATMMFQDNTVVEDTASCLSLSQWKNKEAKSFSQLAIELKIKKELLKKKFLKKHLPPIDDEEICCLFCCGSELYNLIYNVKDSVKNNDGNLPFLSTVLHLEQAEIIHMLRYMQKWMNIAGMDDRIFVWVYALLACLRKPVSEQHEIFLESFYDDISKKSEICKNQNQFHLISAILKNYFLIRAFQIKPNIKDLVSVYM